MRDFGRLPVPEAAHLPAEHEARTICLVAPDTSELTGGGEIEATVLGLAQLLARAGHSVTVLDTGEAGLAAKSKRQVPEPRPQNGVRFVLMPALGTPERPKAPTRRSWAAYCWLRHRPFDFIHFWDRQGVGFYSILAKFSGLAFEHSVLVVSAQGPSLWTQLGNRALVDDVSLLLYDHLEQESVRKADVVVSPSRYLLRWMLEHAWRLPERAYVQPNALPRSLPAAVERQDSAPGRRQIDEIVFFGPFEPGKGILEFCGALRRIGHSLAQRASVTFLGQPAKPDSNFDSQAYLGQQGRNWPFAWKIINEADPLRAFDYLREGDRLAVIPSISDNSSLAVRQCLASGVPFLASNIGGIPELVTEEDQAEVLFRPEVPYIGEALERALREGVIAARPAFDSAENETRWQAWHDAPYSEWIAPPSGRCPVPCDDGPLVTICVLHLNRPDCLAAALESVRRQTYRNFDVVLSDDGSDLPEAIAFLDGLEPEFRERGWTLLRHGNMFRGAARNAAAKAARGEYLMFLDDDNVLKPEAVATFMGVARNLGADILTSLQDCFEGPLAPGETPKPLVTICPVGPAVCFGALRNGFGDSNCFVRRDAFLGIGGLNETYGFGHDDWELFARATFAGLSVHLVPEPLVWYRRDSHKPERLKHFRSSFHMNSVQPFVEAMPPVFQPLVLLARGLDQRNIRLEREIKRLRRWQTPVKTLKRKLRRLLRAGPKS